MRPVIPYLVAALLFGIGTYGVLRRRNAVLVLMAVELMLNAVNLILVTADSTVRSVVAVAAATHTGQVFALFIIVIAAAEVGVGLAIVLQLYRMRGSVVVDTVLLSDPVEQESDPYDAADDVTDDPLPSAGGTAPDELPAGDPAGPVAAAEAAR